MPYPLSPPETEFFGEFIALQLSRSAARKEENLLLSLEDLRETAFGSSG
jgi:hypothetical protein